MLPNALLNVVSFPETPWEPRYSNKIHSLVKNFGGNYYLWEDIRNSNQQFWKNLSIDIIFIVSWRYYIPPEIYTNAKIGAYLFHDSLLPENRGFSPTIWSIINGKSYTGVTLLEVDDQIDSGDIISQARVPFCSNDEIPKILDLVTKQYLKILANNINNLIKGDIIKTPQNHTLATYNPKRTKIDNMINWNHSAKQIYNLIRALTKPYPGAFTYLNKKKIIIWKALVVKDAHSKINNVPGSVIKIIKNKGVVVKTGKGNIIIKVIQVENSGPQNFNDIINNLGIILG